MRVFHRIAGALLGTVIALPAAHAGDTVIVYDASNSMWGQIDGTAKVTIAREVMADIVHDWDEGAPVGLVAYGHRREGDCSDIETVVPVGPVDREAFTARIQSLVPKGKTPLTDALRHAAGELKFREAPATVVLVSDGIESCDADPCAAATELNEAGINFTAHVIGFDVGDADQAQLKCIADNTGGRFFAARDAESLKTALGEAAKEATKTVPEAKVTIAAPETAVAGSKLTVSWSGEDIQPRDLVTIVPAGAVPDARGEYERVGDAASAELLAPGEAGAHEARYVSSATGVAVASAPVELTEPDVSVNAPETVSGGASFDVSWENAVYARDYVTIVPADAPADAYEAYIRVGNAASGSLQAPSEPGDYEVRYLLDVNDRMVASTPVTVEAESVSVTAPESVTGGANFTVEWDNVVHPRDYVTIVSAGAPDDEYATYVRTGDGRSGTLQAPAEPGDYEVRYLLQESGRAVARTPVTVTGQQVSVSAPASVTGGENFNVQWDNVIHPRDYVTIVEAGTPGDEYGEYTRVGNDREGRLQAPAAPGKYEIRYMLQESGQAIARAPITVEEAGTSVSGPESVTGGQNFTVSWTNVIHPRDWVTIVPADAPDDEYGTYTRVGNGTEGRLQAPAEAGDYELRYMLEVNGRTIARAPITVTAAETSVSAPASVTAGADFNARWTNTIYPRDYVTIVPADAAEDAYEEYTRVGNGREGRLQAPAEPGDYEVRYLLEVNGTAIASTPITVTPPEVTVSAPDTVIAGSSFQASWTNGVHPRDKITLVPADAPDGEDGDYKRVGGGGQATLQAPDEPGAYELRYLLEVNGQPVARQPVRVEGE